MHCPFMPQKSINSFIHFSVPNTRKISKFKPKGGTDVCLSTLLQRGRRKPVFRQLRWCCGLTAQPAAPTTPDCHEFGRELRRPTLVQARAQSRWDWMCMGDTDPDFAARSGSVLQLSLSVWIQENLFIGGST